MPVVERIPVGVRNKAVNFVKRHKRILWLAMKIRGKSVSYVDFKKSHVYTFSECFVFAVDWAERLPRKFDVIIGVPRSGICIAQIISQKHGVPLSTPDNFARGEVWFSHDEDGPPKVKRVLVVEDSVGSGEIMREAIAKVKSSGKIEVYSGSLFVRPKATFRLDYFYMIKDKPNIFEWNLLSASWAHGPICCDIDGVLCEECPVEFDDDGPAYVKWLKTAEARMIPNFELAGIMTARLEKYRTLTENWLQSHDVKYKRLYMLNEPYIKGRTHERVVMHKTKAVVASGATWVWESSCAEAEEIRRRTGLPVLCTSNLKLLS